MTGSPSASAAGFGGATALVLARGRSRWRDFPGRGYVGVAIFAVIAVLSFAAPLIAPYAPTATSLDHILSAPSPAHWFGTDALGRDVLSRTLYAGRPSLLLALSIALCAGVIGIPLGLVAGYRGGIVDALIMRACDLIFAVPPIVLALAIVGVLGPDLVNLVIALTIVYAPMLARLTRTITIGESSQLFVTAARCVGDTPARIVTRQIVPNIAGPVSVQMLLVLAYALLYEASLSFLGLGTPPSNPSWGRLLTDAISLTTVAPWTGIFPGLFIFATVIALNIAGDALNHVLDPRARTR